MTAAPSPTTHAEGGDRGSHPRHRSGRSRSLLFPIDKSRTEETAEINPVDGTPDLLIWGKATDGTIDGDHEIVDPEWSAKALQEWAAKGNVRMSHDPKRPVGSGREVHVTTDGHWVKSRICDPLAKHFIRQGVLNDYSVGISNPDFRYGDRKLDPQGKALRVITGRPDGSSRIAELSVVDRGSNFNSAFTIVRKSADGGDGFIGKMIGDESELAKVAPAALVKAARTEDDFVNVDLPENASISISPADFAKLRTFKQQLAQEQAQKRDFDRNVGGGVDRDKIPDADFAGKNRSFPIVTAAARFRRPAFHRPRRAGQRQPGEAAPQHPAHRPPQGLPVPESRPGDSSKTAKPKEPP